MCEVTKRNFEKICPSIIDLVEEAEFICVDCEFTGLRVSSNDKPSLFDDGAERYRKLRKSSSNTTISQIGLSVFVKSAERNKFVSNTFNIYLFPQALGTLDRRFICQASSLQFLCKHHFDFNKFIYEGVSFLNEEEEAIVQGIVQNQELFHGQDRELDEDGLQACCSRVAQWLVTAKDGDYLELTQLPDVSDYVLHTELRLRFAEIWTDLEGRTLRIEKMSPQQRVLIENDKKILEEERITNQMLGFSRIFKALVKAKKPLIGHNMLMDLMLMYDKFYRPLPASYKQFKRSLHALFPVVFDTKHISSNLKRPLQDLGFLEITSLGELYSQLSSEKGRMRFLYSPDIGLAKNCDRYKETSLVHEAGYDSFICGAVFIRMVHMWASRDIASEHASPLSMQCYLEAMEPYKNCVNMIRGSIDNIRLDGEDPASRRPQWLYVRSRRPDHLLTASQLVQRFSSFGSVDICLHSNRQGLIAASTHKCAREILQACYRDKDIVVTRYKPWKHSTLVNVALWAGLAVSASLCAWAILSGVEVTSKSPPS